MSTDFLSEDAARQLVEQYMAAERPAPSTQELLDSGAIPRLKGYVVRPGKVSDCIFGGKGSFSKKSGEEVEFDNPPLVDKQNYPLRMMVRTDRISTHDINRGAIPFKDQVLAMNHQMMRLLLSPYVGTSQYDVNLPVASVVIVAEDLDSIPLEMVLRAYMAKSSTSTSLYHAYVVEGKREFCGHQLSNHLMPNGPLPYVMDTPSTKSEHDESLSPQELFARGLCNPEVYYRIRNDALAAFYVVREFMQKKGLILVDTKTEHGVSISGNIVSQDELYTLDSTRYWLESDYRQQWEAFVNGHIGELNPKSYSKEFARGFSEGEKGYTDDQRLQIAVRYIMGIQLLLGKPFVPDMRSREERVVKGLEKVVEELVAKSSESLDL